MDYLTLHSWDMTADEARAQQTALRSLVSLSDGFGEVRTVAGVDLSLSVETNEGHAVVVVLSYPDFRVLETCYATAPLKMPYIPGLLSFRELPVILAAIAQVQTVPDVIFVDGQGLAHPRGFGIACHLGVLLDRPTLGVAKSRLYGVYDPELAHEPGTAAPLWDRPHQNIIGSVLNTKPRTNPLFVSPGHKMSVDSAAHLVQNCLRCYRLPEPTRLAHTLITAYKKSSTIHSQSSGFPCG